MVSVPKIKMNDVVGELMKRSAPFPVAPKPSWIQFAKNLPEKTTPTDLKVSSDSVRSKESNPEPPAVSVKKIPPVPMPRANSSSSSGNSTPITPVPMPRMNSSSSNDSTPSTPVPMPRMVSSSSGDSTPPVPLPRTKFDIFNTAEMALERSTSLRITEPENDLTNLVNPLLVRSASDPSSLLRKISTDPVLPVVPESTLKETEELGDITWL